MSVWHVECLETRVYWSVIKYTFDIDPKAVDELIRNIDRDLFFGFNQIPLLMIPDVSTSEKKANAMKWIWWKMNWVWRRDYSPSNNAEYNRIKSQVSTEVIDGVPFHKLDEKSKAVSVSSRLKQYSCRAYKRTKITEEETWTNTVYMRDISYGISTKQCRMIFYNIFNQL